MRQRNKLFVCVWNISVLSNLEELCLLIAVSVCFCSEGKEIFFSLLCFIWCVCDQMLSAMNFIHWNSCIQTWDWKEGDLHTWLTPRHGATCPPAHMLSVSSSLSEQTSRLLCIEWACGHFLKKASNQLISFFIFSSLLSHQSFSSLLLYRENEHWLHLMFSVTIPLANDVFVWQ